MNIRLGDGFKLGCRDGVGKAEGKGDVRGVPLTVLQTCGPLKNWEIKVITRIDDEFLEVDFTDGSDRIQVRCGGLDGGTYGRGNGRTR